MNKLRFKHLLVLAPVALVLTLGFTSTKSSGPAEHVVLASLDETRFMSDMRADPNLYILPDGDVISILLLPDPSVPADSVAFELTSEVDITGRKDIYVPSGDPQFEHEHSAGVGDTDNDYLRSCCVHSSGYFRVKVWDVQRYGLLFAKQKGIDIGWHLMRPFPRGAARPRDDRDTDVYAFRPRDRNYLAGKRVIFKWMADNWPQREKGLRIADFMPRNRRSLSDGDLIMLRQENDPRQQPDHVCFSLQTDPSVTWWKEIKVRLWTIAADGRLVEPHTDRNYSPLELPFPYGSDHGPIQNCAVRKSDFYRRGQLVFSKAKFLGIHTEMYKMWGSEFAASGSNMIYFTWIKD